MMDFFEFQLYCFADDSDNQTENVSNERVDDNMIYDLVPSLQVILNERERSSHTWSEEKKELWYR